jgi:hypothetical protein
VHSAVPNRHPSFTTVSLSLAKQSIVRDCISNDVRLSFISSLARCDIFISGIADIKFSAVFVFLK